MLVFRDMNRWLFSLLLAYPIGCLGLQAQAGAGPCDQAFKHGAAAVLDAQGVLQRVKVKDMDTAVPSALQEQIAGFKDALVEATDAIVRCEPANAPAVQLQTDLARVFHANLPQKAESGGDYGSGLKVVVSTSDAAPQSRIVDYTFDIECGDDAVLLVYEPHKDSGTSYSFVRTLRWQSPAYDQISGAFGDFLDYVLIPGLNGKPWRLVVAHGTPWCTSTWSGFQIDLLEARAASPRVVWHDKQFYRRGDVAPQLVLRPNGFELRAEVVTIETDQVFRKGVYRYAVDGDTVRRVQPIAVDGRGFVDAWLQAPWNDAKEWSLPEGLAGFQKAHDAFERGRKDANTTYSYGPVRACLMKGQYEVEIDADPGGRQFYAIREGQNGYMLVNFGTTQDERCSGPDLMKGRPSQNH
jgi:hypothetical protein